MCTIVRHTTVLAALVGSGTQDVARATRRLPEHYLLYPQEVSCTRRARHPSIAL